MTAPFRAVTDRACKKGTKEQLRALCVLRTLPYFALPLIPCAIIGMV